MSATIDLLGAPVRVSPEEAAANKLLFAQNTRRRAADQILYVYRSKATGGQPEDIADEEEIEVGVQGEMTRAESDTGYPGGYELYGAVRIDTGAEIELTPDEIEQASMSACEAAADAAEDYDDSRDDR